MYQAVLSLTTDAEHSPEAVSSFDTLEEIAVALKTGDSKALEALVSKTEKACFHLAYSLLRDRELSRDALQDAYLIVFQRAGQLREPKALKSWLFRIVTHCCHDIRKKRGFELGADVEEKEEAARPPVGVKPEADPARRVADQNRLRQVFGQLPEIDRTALALREICSMSYEEMSRTLGVPLGTVRSRLAKARKRFISVYKGEKS